MPISIAWSTPGAALLASSAMPEGGFPVAVGAFLVSGALIVLAGLWKPLGRGVAAIPAPLASAMLAGVLLGLCLAPVKAVAQAPLAGLDVVLAWALVARFNRLMAVPAAVLAAIVTIALTVTLPPGSLAAPAGAGAGHARLLASGHHRHRPAAVPRHHGLAEHPGHGGAQRQRLPACAGPALHHDRPVHARWPRRSAGMR